MSAATSIEWTDRTWNPVRGCTRVSEGCRHCYAERMASRGFSWGRGFAKATPSGPRWTGKVSLVPGLLDAALRWRHPQRVFVNSMSDLFHEALPFEHIAAVYGAMAAASRHTFQILTKRPERRIAFHEWLRANVVPEVARCAYHFARCGGSRRGRPLPKDLDFPDNTAWPLPNVWEGVSVEDQATADERIRLLLHTPAAVRFISLEPQLAHVDLEPFLQYPPLTEGYKMTFGHSEWRGLDWVIVGGESGPGARPFNVDWARSTVAQCEAAGVPVFVKQLGARPYCAPTVPIPTDRSPLRNRKGGDMSEWPEDLRVREFPALQATT